MKNSNSLKTLSLLITLIVLSTNLLQAETPSDSTAAPSKFRFGFLIGPIASIPVLSINQHDLNRVYDPSELPYIYYGTSATFEKASPKLTGGLSIGLSLTYRINERLNLNFSPSFNLIEPKITSTLFVTSNDTIIFPDYTLTYNTFLGESILELPVSFETNPFKSKPNFLTSAGLSLKYEIRNSTKLNSAFIYEPFIRTNRYGYDFFLSTKFLSPKKQNGFELKFSYSLRDMIYRKDSKLYSVGLPVNSIHLFTSSLLFHIK